MGARHIALSDSNVKMECVVQLWFFDKLSTPLVTFTHSIIHPSNHALYMINLPFSNLSI